MSKESKIKKPSCLNREALEERLRPSIFSRNVLVRDKLPSTNTLAKELAAQGAPEGTLVVAEEQTAGRGRMGRVWLSPPAKNLLFSILLRPAVPPNQVFSLTMTLALSSISAVEASTGVSPLIKWPNDLYVGSKKLGGILTEFSVSGGGVEYAVLGLGLNVNWSPGSNPEMLYPATSVMAETGRETSRLGLLTSILTHFDRRYQKRLPCDPDALYARWNEKSMVLNNWVEIDAAEGKICGRARRIDRQGALIVQDESGKETRVLCGDVGIRFRAM